jgi:hypothetical protein
MSIEAIAKTASLVTKHSWQVFLFCLLIILIPDHLFKVKGASIKAEYIGFAWLTLVVSGVFAIGHIASLVNKTRTLHQRKASVIKRLDFLDDHEKCWIFWCLESNVQTICAARSNPTANSLMSKGFLYMGSGDIQKCPFHFKDFVWDYLKENEKLFLESLTRHADTEQMLKYAHKYIVTLKDDFSDLD